MDYEKLQVLFAKSSSMKLLRARHAPLIISFLYKEFKIPNKITIPNYELVDKLADYLEALNFHDEDEEEDVFEDVKFRARNYIESWCSEQNKYLRKYPGEKGEDVHELTPSTEKVIQWIQDLEYKGFVGTESMFLDIVRKLEELYHNSTEDPEHKLAVLERQKAEIEAQIQEIEASGAVRIFNTTQIKERFYEINRLARRLLADFREVEQNFRSIVRAIYQKQSEKDQKKGEILGYVLDESDALKESDQGRSFYTFWHVLMDRSRREELEHLIEQMYQVLEERQLSYPDTFLKNMKFHLLEAGKKVVNTNHLLVEKLKRILTGQSTLERKRAIELIGEIKKLALQVMPNPPDTDQFIEVEGNPYIHLPMERPLGEQPQETIFENHPTEIGSDDLTQVDFTSLMSQFDINKEELVTRIQQYLKRKPQVTLTEILDEHPINKGLAELLTYFSIASQSSKHLIIPETYEIVQLHGDSGRFVKIPQIIFTK
jgi:hypothetical protein